jgi:hypothetical protein
MEMPTIHSRNWKQLLGESSNNEPKIDATEKYKAEVCS